MYIIQLLIRHIYGAHEFYTSRTLLQTPIKLTLDYGGHSLARQ